MPFDLPGGEEEKVYTVSEISRLIKNTLEDEFPSVWVEGEISKVLDHSSGHIYLTLKDNQASLDANLWKQKRGVLKFDLEVGMQVLVRGRISAYAPYGKYNLIVDQIEPVGIGALQIKFEQLKKKLSAKGYFDEQRKKPIPAFPKSIGVVTSPTGAAFRDISRILKRRDPGVKIILAPALVEGERAKDEIAEAIDDFNTYGRVDLLIVGRGGGAPESLWAFNEEVVADAIFRSKIPVISAVGHEIDFTISDFVADLRASTPSAAAELAVKERSDVIHTVAIFFKRILTALQTQTREYKNRVNDLLNRPVYADPTRFLEDNRQWVDESILRITNAVKRNRLDLYNSVTALFKQLQILRPENLVKRKREHVENLLKLIHQRALTVIGERRRLFATAGGKLDMLSPLKVLERGYSITMKPDGEVIKDEAQVKQGDEVKIRLHQGKLTCEVKSKEKGTPRSSR